MLPETPDATVMLIAGRRGARADMVLVVGDAAVTSGAVNIHRLGDRSLASGQPRCANAPRGVAAGVSASLALVNDDVAITEVSHHSGGQGALVRDLD